MSDQHSNLFYSYNQDTELIENNLTRALIVTLRLLSGPARALLLNGILADPIQGTTNREFHLPSFSKTEFALQGDMEKRKVREFPKRFVLTIASDRYSSPDNGENSEFEEESFTYSPVDGVYSSIPDAWIYNEDEGYCFLIEAKVGLNQLYESQVISHASDWLGFSDRSEIQDHIISTTWFDVLEAIHQVLAESFVGKLDLNQQESQILEALCEFLGFYGYWLFQGFNFKQIPMPLDFRLFRDDGSDVYSRGFSNLGVPPSFRLSTSNSPTDL